MVLPSYEPCKATYAMCGWLFGLEGNHMPTCESYHKIGSTILCPSNIITGQNKQPFSQEGKLGVLFEDLLDQYSK